MIYDSFDGDSFFLRWLIITTDWSWWLCCLLFAMPSSTRFWQLSSSSFVSSYFQDLFHPQQTQNIHTQFRLSIKALSICQTLNLITLKSPCRLTWIFRYKFSRLRLRDENAQLSTLRATRNPPLSRRFVCLLMFMSAGSFDLDKSAVFLIQTEFLFFEP